MGDGVLGLSSRITTIRILTLYPLNFREGALMIRKARVSSIFTTRYVSHDSRSGSSAFGLRWEESRSSRRRRCRRLAWIIAIGRLVFISTLA